MKFYKTNALIACAVLAGGLGACKGRDTAAGDSVLRTDSAAGRVDSAGRTAPGAMMDSTRRPDSANRTANANSAWSPASILGFTNVANTGEIGMGQLGAKKATNAQVKAYARQMVTDHRAMMAEGKTLASKLSATADTAANDARDLMNHGRDAMKDLTDKSAGADWDKNFMDKMIDDHQNVLDKLQDAAKNTTSTDLRAALEKATGKVQEHLTKAKDIKANTLKD